MPEKLKYAGEPPTPLPAGGRRYTERQDGDNNEIDSPGDDD
jgi:hypothetical protein